MEGNADSSSAACCSVHRKDKISFWLASHATFSYIVFLFSSVSKLARLEYSAAVAIRQCLPLFVFPSAWHQFIFFSWPLLPPHSLPPLPASLYARVAAGTCDA